jgi:periplasmic copper chaperone A
MRCFVALLSLVSTSVFSQVSIENAWSRATAPGARVGAGYFTIRNKSAAPDRLVGASSPAAARVETHVIEKQGEVLRMREVKGYAVPAKGSFELKPGGAHLMLVDIKAPLKEGDRVPLTLKFEKAGEVSVQLRVEPLGATPGHMHH